LKDAYSHRKALLVLIAVVLYVVYILPYKLYSLNVIDRHHLGWFDDLDPTVAVTTAEANSYKDRGIPYKTMTDLKHEHKEENRRVAAGEDSLYQHHYEKFFVSNMASRMLSSHDEADNSDPVVEVRDTGFNS
jgi:hypothetical protein